ncbi:MAG: DUF3883 domain-containing protein [Campylobacterota bacterium]|nr:DUF3883 domain-containing protein [Campylobacterota bacterium]
MQICEQNNSMSKNDIDELGYNQGGVGRHKCVICAYNYGLEDGQLHKNLLDKTGYETCEHGSQAPIYRIESIHDNQKSSQGRHKCLICAYELGFNRSLEDTKTSIINNKRTSGTLRFNKQHKATKTTNKIRKKDYIEEQKYKTLLGLMGEKLVVKHLEQDNYTVDHISLSDDTIGYDIRAIKNGITQYIEVKTTTKDFNTDFFISKNELNFMTKNINNYFLYRVYNYDFKTNDAEFDIIHSEDIKNNYTKDCISYKVQINE